MTAPTITTAAAEQRSARLLRIGTACIVLCLLCVVSLRFVDLPAFLAAALAALAASVLGLWARAAAPAASPSRTTGLILALVGLLLSLLFAFFSSVGP